MTDEQNNPVVASDEVVETPAIQFNPENKQPVDKILFSQQRQPSTKDLIYKNLFS
jgi:hypothetical protein